MKTNYTQMSTSSFLRNNKFINIFFFYKTLSHSQKIIVAFLFFLRVIFTPIAFIIHLVNYLVILYEIFLNKNWKISKFFKKTRLNISTFSIVTTGGTGGHLFPAIEFASRAVISRKITLVCDKNIKPLLEKRYKTKNNFEKQGIYSSFGVVDCFFLPIIPLKKNLQSFLCFVLSMLKIFFYFLKNCFFIRNIIGFGGYVSFPVLFFAVILRKKIFIHEQNAVFGKMNLIFLCFASKIFTFLPIKTTLKNVINVGMPLPLAIESRERIIIRKKTDMINILIISGSSGGIESNKSILPAVINFSKKHKNIHVMHQVSNDFVNDVVEKYIKHNISCDVRPFFDNIYDILEITNVAISRAGASSIVDLLSFGVPTIFIPLKTSADNHQVKNANWVVSNNLGLVHKPWESNSYNLSALINLCVSDELALRSLNIGQFAIKRGASMQMLKEIF